MAEQVGELSVLNCGSGDIRVTFDKDDPLETERAKRIVMDMLKRGYALFVETPKGLRKVKSFNADACEYIIADGPTVEPPMNDANSSMKSARPWRRRVPMKTSRATGVGPTSGG